VVKVKSLFLCGDCGATQPKWSGQCGACLAWNTLKEERALLTPGKPVSSRGSQPAEPRMLSDVIVGETIRLTTGLKEVDRLLGGGLVAGSLTLMGGEPGVGKSTLMLQVAAAFANSGKRVLYVSGEESCEQTALRAQRLGLSSDKLYLLSEIRINAVLEAAENLKPDLLIVDSIQIVFREDIASSSGTVTQVRECAFSLLQYAKDSGVPTFIIGHVTKSGDLAGPKILEHLVDTVLYFEGERQHHFRVLRSQKNRFGTTDEVAVFLMREGGLQEVPNPSQFFFRGASFRDCRLCGCTHS
jgi:Predicted ATP-dependent serine protease